MLLPLAEQTCIPCKKGSPAMTATEIADQLPKLPGWALRGDGKAITRKFTFRNFVTALAFVNALGEIAEKANHHPDIALGWGYAEITFQTHSIGGLHINDFILAAKTSAIAAA